MMLKKFLYLFFIALFLVGCASTGLQDRAGLRELIRQYRFDDAIAYIENNSFFNKDQNKYLKHQENIIFCPK